MTFTSQGTLLGITHIKTIQFRERQLEIPLPHVLGSPLCLVTTLQQKNGCHERTWIQQALRARGNLTSAYDNLLNCNLISIYTIKCPRILINCPQPTLHNNSFNCAAHI